MRKLAKPVERSEDVFINCISNMHEGDPKNRLTSCKDLIIAASKEFDIKVATQELHTIDKIFVTKETKDTKLVGGLVTVEELKDVYTNKFVPEISLGRELYNKLKSKPKYGTCPLCSHRKVKQLDHHLPKANYPLLCLTPTNLVPSCTDCNDIKDNICPTKAEEETIHPYFDDIENEEWLFADVIHSTPAVLTFKVVKPIGWSELLFKRVTFHFNTLELNSLYSTEAASLLPKIKGNLEQRFLDEGAIGVKRWLLENADSYSKENPNSWEVATFRATANDDWYCDGGFKLI